MPKILLHACCGPCALMPLTILRGEGWDPVLFWFNPNIHPAAEWIRRLDALREVSLKLSVPLIEEGSVPDPAGWITALGEKKKEGERCPLCYTPRLERSAALAAEQNFDAFTSSLLYSRYQRHDDIRMIAEKAAIKYGADFLYRDFRTFWYDGIAMSKELGIYRQKWCGCLLSMTESLQQQKEAAERKAAEKAEKAARLAIEAEKRRQKQEAFALKKKLKEEKRIERIKTSLAERENQHGNKDENASSPADSRKILVP